MATPDYRSLDIYLPGQSPFKSVFILFVVVLDSPGESVRLGKNVLKQIYCFFNINYRKQN